MTFGGWWGDDIKPTSSHHDDVQVQPQQPIKHAITVQRVSSQSGDQMDSIDCSESVPHLLAA